MKKTDTKTSLLNYAQELIQRVGVNGMSYSDLAEKVGIRKASVHYHFPKKEDLIISLLESCGAEYSTVYQDIVDSDFSPKEKLFQIAEIFESGLKNGKVCIIGVLSVDLASMGEAVKKVSNEAVKKTASIFAQIFDQAAGLNIDSYAAGYGFFSFLLGLQILSRSNNDLENFRAAAELYIESILPSAKRS